MEENNKWKKITVGLLVEDHERNDSWAFAGIYGHPEKNNKWKTWRLIKHLAAQNENKVFFVGDFNDVVVADDKKGGNPRSMTQLALGRNVLAECGLSEFGYEGYPFTWFNGREGSENIQCRHDRAMGNEGFNNYFSPIRVIHLTRFGSDHAAILVHREVDPNVVCRKRVHVFRFEDIWSKDPRCEKLINSSMDWETKVSVVQGLNNDFQEYRVSEVKKGISRLENQLKEAHLWDGSPDNIIKFKELEKEHGELLQVEEVIWRQKSRAVWLKDGDKNTKFFHGKENQRRKINEISKMKDEHGILWRGDKNVERLLVNYFSSLFTTSDPVNMELTCEVIRDRLSAYHISWCSRTYSDEEIEESIKQMHPLRAPGPDGLPTLFYQKYWHLVGNDVKRLVKGILNNQESPEKINKTFIVLIPKGKDPKSPKDYRPISLCNVSMKIVTKVIAKRIKSIFPDVIDAEQSGFVEGRLITDNGLIDIECFHWLKKKRKGKKGMMAVKLDMSKAYDRIEWPFVQVVLTAMGFPKCMVSVIMRCISSVSYQILINGQPSKSFQPEQGLR